MQRVAESAEVRALRDRLHKALEDGCGGVTLNGHETERLPNTLNLRFHGADAESVMGRTPAVACSSGSACHSGASSPSHVLLAMGLSNEAASESIRFSLSRHTTREDVDRAADAIASSVASIRELLVGVI
jgi:cysteine desulfurase